MEFYQQMPGAVSQSHWLVELQGHIPAPIMGNDEPPKLHKPQLILIKASSMERAQKEF